MTLDQVLAESTARLDSIIERQLSDLEAQIRSDIATTGPENEEALDRPPDPDSPWRRITLEETLMLQRERLLVWRDQSLAELCKQLLDDKQGW